MFHPQPAFWVPDLLFFNIHSVMNLDASLFSKDRECSGVPRCGSAVMKLTSKHDTGLAQWLRIRHCHVLWCRSQMQLGSQVAITVAVAAAAAPIQPLAWELPYTANLALKSQKKKRRGG